MDHNSEQSMRPKDIVDPEIEWPCVFLYRDESISAKWGGTPSRVISVARDNFDGSFVVAREADTYTECGYWEYWECLQNIDSLSSACSDLGYDFLGRRLCGKMGLTSGAVLFLCENFTDEHRTLIKRRFG